MDATGGSAGGTGTEPQVEAVWFVKVALLFLFVLAVGIGLGIGLGVIPVGL
jgi:hypothetical protein